MEFKGPFGKPFQSYTAGTNSGATASVTAVTGQKHYVTDVTFWSDTDSIISILGGAAGGTVIWEGSLDVDVGGLSKTVNFTTPLVGASGIKVEAKVTSSSSDCGVTVQGYTA